MSVIFTQDQMEQFMKAVEILKKKNAETLGEQLEEQLNIVLDCIETGDDRLEFFIDRVSDTIDEIKRNINK